MVELSIVPKEAEPLPCPFCGETALDFSGAADDSNCCVTCPQCLCEGPIVLMGFRVEDNDPVDLEAEAVELWNARRG